MMTTGRRDRRPQPCAARYPLLPPPCPCSLTGWEGASGAPSVAGSEGRPGLLLLPAQRVAPGACEAHSDVQPRAAGATSCPARAQKPCPGGWPRLSSGGLQTPSGCHSGLQETTRPSCRHHFKWWPHTSGGLRDTSVSLPAHAGPAGCGGAPSPAGGARRGPSAGVTSVSRRKELGCGKCRAWSSLCFKALTRLTRSCEARDLGAGAAEAVWQAAPWIQSRSGAAPHSSSGRSSGRRCPTHTGVIFE